MASFMSKTRANNVCFLFLLGKRAGMNKVDSGCTCELCINIIAANHNQILSKQLMLTKDKFKHIGFRLTLNFISKINYKIFFKSIPLHLLNFIKLNFRFAVCHQEYLFP